MESFIETLKNIKTPYETDSRKALSYPGTNLDIDFGEIAKIIIPKNLNSIGVHTFTKEAEGGFDVAHDWEREYIYWISSFLYKTVKSEEIENLIDGYFTSGGTEANLEGLWIAREYMKKLNSESEIKIFTTKVSHYSIIKSLKLLGFNIEKDLIYIDYNEFFEMDINDLNEKIKFYGKNDIKNFIVVINLGSTVTGSIDNISEINNVINNNKQII